MNFTSTYIDVYEYNINVIQPDSIQLLSKIFAKLRYTLVDPLSFNRAENFEHFQISFWYNSYEALFAI